LRSRERPGALVLVDGLKQAADRPHIRIFINETQTHSLETPLRPDDEIFIVYALSGG